MRESSDFIPTSQQLLPHCASEGMSTIVSDGMSAVTAVVLGCCFVEGGGGIGSFGTAWKLSEQRDETKE